MAKKVFINAGHGGKDPGAVAFGMHEDDIVLVVAKEMERVLKEHGIEVGMSRSTDVDEELYEIVNEANAFDADVFVSIHCNADAKAAGDGSETYYWSTSINGKKLAQLCEKHTQALGQNSRGVKPGNHLYVIKNTHMVAVLCECAFLTNYKDNDIIDTVAEQKAFGVAYAKAVLEYFGKAYKAPVAPAKPTDNKATGYGQTQFVKDIQKAIGAEVDGIAGPETLSKTVTLSEDINYKHAAVKPVQKRLAALGYDEVGTADGVAGPKFTAAVAHYQQDKGCYVDGEITARNTTWKKLLKLA